jgi:hypothetical protein
MTQPPAIPACQSLYVVPDVADAVASCGLRLLRDRRGGRAATVVVVFAAPAWPAPAPDTAPLREFLAAGAVEVASLALPSAVQRDPEHSSALGRGRGWSEADEACLSDAAAALVPFARGSRAEDVYLPLGVSGHVDYRLVLEAGLRCFRSGNGRNVFLYEERPEALVKGAVRARLGSLGAQLPPEAAESAEAAGLLPFLGRRSSAAALRLGRRGWMDRLRLMGLAGREWRQGRRFSPRRGLGPRLQPVVDPEAPPEEALPRVAAWASLEAAHAARLGRRARAERYWLLLPPRARDGSEALLPAEGTET